MALKTFGLMGVDWEERVDLERLRQDRLSAHQSGAQELRDWARFSAST